MTTNDGAQVKITGIEDLLGKIESISDDVRIKSGKASLRKAAQVIMLKAKALALRIDDPETAENIAANISTQFSSKHFKQTGDLMYRIGVMGGARAYANTKHNVRKRQVGKMDGDKGNPGGDTFYWRFHEFGTRTVKKRPFLRPALQNNVEAAISAFVSEYEKAIDRAIKRAKKKRMKE